MWIERRIEGDRSARMRLDAAPLDARQARGARPRKHARVDRDRRCGPASPSSATSRRSATLGAEVAARSALGPWETLLDPVLRLRHLRQRRLDARAGVQVHVPVRALPERDVRPRHADHHLRRARAASRAARARARRRPAARRAWATASTARCACRSARPASTSARACSTNASAAPPASTPATSVMDKMGYPRGPDPLRDRERASRSGWTRAQMWRRVLRPRVLVYGAVLLAIVGARSSPAWRCARRSRSTWCATAARWRAWSSDGRDRERLPAADHERDRAPAALPRSRVEGLPGAAVASATPARGRPGAGALGAGARAACRTRRAAPLAGAHPMRSRSASSAWPTASTTRARCSRSPPSSCRAEPGDDA